LSSLELKNVSKIYDNNVEAVSNVNLNIADKEFVVLVGPSGCGKSTLLRMIAGLEDISKGELYIDGNLVNHLSPKDRDIAMVFQNYALYPHMSVFDNLAFGLKIRKFKKDVIKQQVEKAAEILDLVDFLNRKPKALSGGQRQRVAVGRAIVRNPKVFLFDEPLSNLDAKLRVQMRIEINRLHNKLQTTMIYVTHDQTEAMTMGTKIVVLKEGKIQQVAPPLELYNNPVNKFVAGFIGSPAMNFIPGELKNENRIVFKSELFDIEVTNTQKQKLEKYINSKIILGIRPENIYDVSQVHKTNAKTIRELKIDVVEPIGNEIFVYFEQDGHNFCMRMPPDKLYKSGDKIKITLDWNKMHFFDTTSELRIT